MLNFTLAHQFTFLPPPSLNILRLYRQEMKAWLADVFARIADLPVSRLRELLLWEWKRLRQAEKASAQATA